MIIDLLNIEEELGILSLVFVVLNNYCSDNVILKCQALT